MHITFIKPMDIKRLEVEGHVCLVDTYNELLPGDRVVIDAQQGSFVDRIEGTFDSFNDNRVLLIQVDRIHPEGTFKREDA